MNILIVDQIFANGITIVVVSIFHFTISVITVVILIIIALFNLIVIVITAAIENVVSAH